MSMWEGSRQQEIWEESGNRKASQSSPEPKSEVKPKYKRGDRVLTTGSNRHGVICERWLCDLTGEPEYLVTIFKPDGPLLPIQQDADEVEVLEIYESNLKEYKTSVVVPEP